MNTTLSMQAPSTEHISDLARRMVLSEEDFGKAKSLIIDLIGSEESSLKVLSGYYTLESDDENKTCFLAEFKNNERYLNDLQFIYRNYFKKDGKTYKAYRAINSLGYIDHFSDKKWLALTKVFTDTYETIDDDFMKDVFNEINDYLSNKEMINCKLTRALHYSDNEDDICFHIVSEDFDDYYILCEEIKHLTPPIVDKNTLEDVLFELIKSNSEFNQTVGGFESSYTWYKDQLQTLSRHDNFRTIYDNYVYDVVDLENYKLLKNKILNDNNVKKNGFIELYDENKVLLCKAPFLPFLYWSLKRNHVEHILDTEKLKYKPYSKSGWKMPMDCPYHTDWMIGANLNFEDDYNSDSKIQRSAYKKMFELQTKYLNFETTVLSKGNYSSFKGRIFICTKDNASEVKEGMVLIIPDASVDYEEHVRRSIDKNGKCGIITLTGSKVAHMAIVAREKGIILMLDSDALSKYKNFCSVTLNSQNGIIQINN